MENETKWPEQYNEEARAACHAVVDLLFQHVRGIESKPVVDWTRGADLRELVKLGAAQAAEGVDRATELVELFAQKSIQLHHPSYMGHQVCPPLPIAAIADFAISVMNQSTAVWEMSPIGTTIEREIIRWLADRVNYPESASGTTVSGGSAANLTGLLAARARWRHDHPSADKTPVIFCSADAHYSIARAAAMLGIAASDVIEIATDDDHAMDVGELAAALEALEGTDRRPLAIVATSGSTATGAFDRLLEIADLRDQYRTWLHVDAAHGASVLLSPEYRHLMSGIERADSLSWDPHKMLWMPLSLGVILVRDERWLRDAFEAKAPYLFHRDAAEQNLGEMTIQCSRRADAVKLWIALKVHGVAYFAGAIEQVARLGRRLDDLLRASDDFEALHQPQFNIACFRYVGDRTLDEESLDDLNASIRQRLIESGEAWITSTLLKGKRALRVTLINPRTTVDHLAAMLESVRRVARELLAARTQPQR
jgi:L-2,4-diaminobutyrate decarboxylase